MSRTPRMLLCNCFFWSKVTFALVLALSGILFCSIRVYDLRQYALADLRRSAVIRNNGSIPIPTNADGTATTQCYHDENGLARLEIPDRGRMMMGFHLNWEVDNPTAITNRLGRVAPAVINAFMKVDMTQIRPFDFDSLRWHGYEVQKVGGILELTLEPVSDIDGIPDTFYDEVARELRAINSEKGVPVFLRWGHEMNGDWVLAYGYRPISYKTSFIKMADAVRRYTNMTAMVWAPNVGIQYPFNAAPGDGSAPKPRPGTAEFRELDTDNNGVIAPGDDPYLPYYPGDEHVDWVGLSIYFYPLADSQGLDLGRPNLNDEIPSPEYLRRQMNLVDLENQVALPPNMTWEAFRAMLDFYDRFCRQRNKPMMIPETGAPFVLVDDLLQRVPDRQGELAIKKAWWTQMWSRDTISLWPKLKLAVQFEETKWQHRKFQSWAVTNASGVGILEEFNGFVEEMRGTLVMARDMEFKCDGSVVLR